MKKLIKVILIVLASFGVITLGASIGLTAWANNGGGEVANVVKSAASTIFMPLTNSNVENFKKQMGGVACGICHPENDAYNVSLLKEANIGWVRFDIPSESPYLIDKNGKAIKDKDGNYQLRPSYINYKNRCMIFKNQGIKVMGITPYIDDMLNEVGEIEMFNKGKEDFSDNFKNFVKEVSIFYANDLQGVVDCFQISNELTIDKWQGAITTDQICYYQGELQMKVMYPITSAAGIPIGFNTQGYSLYDYPKQMCDEYGEYFDYVGLDLYLGCFEASYHTTAIFDLLVRNFYAMSNKPVMLNEFGYISAGQPKNEEERALYLKETYGEEFSTEEKIKANIVAFLDKFDEVTGEENGSPMTREARRVIEEKGGVNNQEALQAAIDYIFGEDQIAHLYKALPDGYYLSNYEHNKEGQGEFFKDTISRLSSLPYVCGYFAYMYSDSEECYQCGGEGCPVETGWGLVTLGEKHEGSAPYDSTNVTLKPSFYALQETFGKIQKSNKKYNK